VKLSERLEAACTGVLVAEATGNLDIVTDAVNKLLDAAREAAELARRVEGAHREYVCRVYDCDKGEDRGEVFNTVPVHLAGKYVRLVPEAGQGVGDG
jgi:hypothetical protein